jgi:hypothetical protein
MGTRCPDFTDEQTANMTDEFCQMMNVAREIYGFPIVWVDGFRTPEHNAAVGGKSDSPHLTGEAFDVQAPQDPLIRERLAWALGRAGFTNVESAPRHFHFTCSKKVPQNAYYAGTDN